MTHIWRTFTYGWWIARQLLRPLHTIILRNSMLEEVNREKKLLVHIYLFFYLCATIMFGE